MRQTALPLLRDLPAGALVSRCEFCRCFTLSHEVCQGGKETETCPPRCAIEAVTVREVSGVVSARFLKTVEETSA